MDAADNPLLVTRAPGYQLRVAAEDTDALLFESLVRDGRRAFADGDPQGAARQLTEALALWHGRPLADVPPTPLVEAEAERLTSSAWAPSNCVSRPNSPAAAMTRPSPRSAGCWRTTRCARACGCC